MSDLVIIKAKPEHVKGIVTNWLDSFFDSHYAGTFAAKGPLGFEAVYRPHIVSILERPETVTYCVVLREREGFYIGWICGAEYKNHAHELAKQPVIHYLYVKDGGAGSYRHQGVANRLVKHLGVNPKEKFVYTHRTKLGDAMIRGMWVDSDGRESISTRLKPAWAGARHVPSLARYPDPPPNWEKRIDAA